jgi:transcriptional regulator with XRE-family HTH domain
MEVLSMNKDPQRVHLGRFLRDKRQALRLSQKEVADQVGWHQTEISALEGGRQVTLDMSKLVKLGRVYGVTPNEISEAAGWFVGPPSSPMDFYWSLIHEAVDGLPPDQYHTIMSQLANIARGARRAWEQKKEGAQHNSQSVAQAQV